MCETSGILPHYFHTMELSEILHRINRAIGRFEREAVEAAMLRQDEITPELLQILQKLLRILENAPQMYAQIDPLGDYTAHLYAMFRLPRRRIPICPRARAFRSFPANQCADSAA